MITTRALDAHREHPVYAAVGAQDPRSARYCRCRGAGPPSGSFAPALGEFPARARAVPSVITGLIEGWWTKAFAVHELTGAERHPREHWASGQGVRAGDDRRAWRRPHGAHRPGRQAPLLEESSQKGSHQAFAAPVRLVAAAHHIDPSEQVPCLLREGAFQISGCMFRGR